MKKGWLLALSALALAQGVWGQTGEVTLTVRLLSQRLLPAEPLPIEVRFFNGTGETVTFHTYDGAGFKVRKPDGTVESAAWFSSSMPQRPVAAGEEVVLRTDLGGAELFLLREPGAYELRAEYESPGRVFHQGQVYGKPPRYRDCWKGRLEGGPCPFEVIAPEGVDLQAYDRWLRPYGADKRGLAGWYVVRESAPENGKNTIQRIDLLVEILAAFPTSTYAGYVLAKKVPDYSDPLFHPTPPQEQLKQCRDKGKTFVTFPDKAFEEYFQQLDRFMKGGRVPESLRASLWCFYGDQLVRRGKYPEAEQAFSEAAKGTEPGDPKEKAYWHRAQESLNAFGNGDNKPVASPPENPSIPPAAPLPAKAAPASPAPPPRRSFWRVVLEWNERSRHPRSPLTECGRGAIFVPSAQGFTSVAAGGKGVGGGEGGAPEARLFFSVLPPCRSHACRSHSHSNPFPFLGPHSSPRVRIPPPPGPDRPGGAALLPPQGVSFRLSILAPFRDARRGSS